MARVKKGGGDVVSTPQQFWDGASGRWAGERLAQAAVEGRELSASELRVLGTLREYEWIQFDEVVVEESVIRLRAVGDLISRGLVKSIPNGLGKTLLHYDKAGDMSAAAVSLDGIADTVNDVVEFEAGYLPLPITHKDFFINLRKLAASRNMGEPLDTMQARIAGRLVAEKIERMLFVGGPTFGGNAIYGYLTEPNRNTGGFVANGDWSQTAKTGGDIVNDVLKMIGALNADGFFGPFGLYVPSAAGPKLEDDFKTYGSITIRQRLMEIDQVASVLVCDQQTAATVVMAQLTEDVACIVEGEPLQTIQWDVHGGMRINFKAMTIQVPLVRSTKADKSGVYHMS